MRSNNACLLTIAHYRECSVRLKAMGCARVQGAMSEIAILRLGLSVLRDICRIALGTNREANFPGPSSKEEHGVAVFHGRTANLAEYRFHRNAGRIEKCHDSFAKIAHERALRNRRIGDAKPSSTKVVRL